MLSWLTKLFTPSPKKAPAAIAVPAQMPAPNWRRSNDLSLPCAQSFRKAIHHISDTQPYWHALYDAWLKRLGPELTKLTSYAPSGFNIAWRQFGTNSQTDANHSFVLLTPLGTEQTEHLARFCERIAKRIAQRLPGLAEFRAEGALPILVFPDAELYDRYVHAVIPEYHGIASAGMFLISYEHASEENDENELDDFEGLPHFIVLADEIDAAEPTLVHEMTHAMLSHLYLPLWLDEGIATCMEQSVATRYQDPGSALTKQSELMRKHQAHWNTQTADQLWSGQAFRQEEYDLAYDMARRIVLGLSRDMPLFTEFAKSADCEDGGAQACQQIYGVSLQELLELQLR